MMSSVGHMHRIKVGFHVRNRFQIGHFQRLFATFDDAVWICRSRSLRKYLKGLGYPHVMRPSEIQQGLLDVLLIQGGVEPFMRRAGCRLFMVQYGYAKAPYNFGLWRAAADVVLAYGPYAQTRFRFLTNSTSVGNPRWDDFLDPTFQQRAKARYENRLLNGLPMVVYAPTWGDLSSITDWSDAVRGLAGTANVFIKAHHNAAGVRGTVSETESDSLVHVHFVPDDDLFELLVCADLLISDFSGAIFDALLCMKPVVLLDRIDESIAPGKKLDDLSIEVVERRQLGRQVSDPAQLPEAVREVLANSEWYVGRTARLREQLFDLRPGVCERIATVCRAVVPVNEADVSGQMSLYVHRGVRELVEKMGAAKSLLRLSLSINALLIVCVLVGIFWQFLFC